MKNKKLKLCAILLLSLGLSGLQAQEAIPATGGNASGTGGSASYSVGQVFYTTSIGTNGNSIAEGVQQPYEISVVSGIAKTGINLEISAYPNPTTDYLYLTVGTNNETPQLSYQLFDTNGKILQNKKITADKTEIKTEELTQGSYFLQIRGNQKEVKTFKIIKN